jgi:hypothetical protein
MLKSIESCALLALVHFWRRAVSKSRKFDRALVFSGQWTARWSSLIIKVVQAAKVWNELDGVRVQGHLHRLGLGACLQSELRRSPLPITFHGQREHSAKVLEMEKLL